jgi:hypothetical protein
MIKAFKYRLYPNINQVRELETMLERIDGSTTPA